MTAPAQLCAIGRQVLKDALDTMKETMLAIDTFVQNPDLPPEARGALAMRELQDQRHKLLGAVRATADALAQDDPVSALIARHAALAATHPAATFELMRLRRMGWTAFIATTPVRDDPRRMVLAVGQGASAAGACAEALASLDHPPVLLGFGEDLVELEEARETGQLYPHYFVSRAPHVWVELDEARWRAAADAFECTRVMYSKTPDAPTLAHPVFLAGPDDPAASGGAARP